MKSREKYLLIKIVRGFGWILELVVSIKVYDWVNFIILSKKKLSIIKYVL